MTVQLFILLAGIGLLWLGADVLVKYASRLARALGVSAIVIGLSIVSMGTSLPEFVVSLIAALQKNTGIAMGNIVGSNIANIGLVLGVGAFITPLKVKASWVRREVPFMIGVTLVFYLFSASGKFLVFWEGVVLVVLMLLFLFYLLKYSREDLTELEIAEAPLPEKITSGRKVKYFLLSLVGMALLVAGSKLTVGAGVTIAKMLRVSDVVIGLTMVAVGTSLPELATTIVGVLHGETDIVVGNVIGSNIFNLLFIGGVIPLVHPIPVTGGMLLVQFPILVLLSSLLVPIMKVGLSVGRWESLLLLLIYAAFIFLTIRF